MSPHRCAGWTKFGKPGIRLHTDRKYKTLAQDTDWMKGLMTVLPDGRYEVKSFAVDAARNNVAAYGFHGTHTGPGGPVPPTGRSTSSPGARGGT